MKNAPLDQTLSLDDYKIHETVAALYGALSREKLISDIYSRTHREEDARALQSMGLGN